MDHKRNLLIAALAVVSYFMLLAWNNDNPAQTAPAITVTSQKAVNQSALDIPSAADEKSAGIAASPLPVAGAGAPTTTDKTGDAYISVSTPIQHVMIDPVGGDIVSVSLPHYPSSLDTPNEAFQLLRNDSAGLYIAQSGLIGPNGIDADSNGRPRYTSAKTTYSAESGDLVVDLNYLTDSQVEITKRFIFSSSDYLIHQQFLIKNNSAAEWRGNVFGQIKRDGSKDPSSKGGVRLNNFLGAAMTSADDPYIKIKFADFDKHKDPVDVAGGWIAFSQHYFLSAWIPDAAETNKLSVLHRGTEEYLMRYVGPEHSVAPGQSITISSSLWAGPKNQDRLEEISKNLGLTIDYGMFWFVGSPIFHLLSWIYSVVGNYGVAIILLTIVIRSLFYPLSAKQFASSHGMKRIQPKMAQLKERHGDDKQKLMQAQMELWKKEKVSPLSGCLPIFLQMPVFLGIYWVLNESVELRQAPFILWYRDLSAIDPYFILPLLMGAVNFLQQHMNPMPTADPMQAKMMKFTPVIFTVFFLWMPAGLVLYYLVSGLLGLFQQWFFNTRQNRKAANDS